MNPPSRSRRPLALGLALAAALAAGGCSGASDDERADGTGGVTTTVAQAPGTGATPVTDSTSTSATAATSTFPAAPLTTAAPARTVTLARFQTPTGNIACDASGDGVRCDIQERSWTPPPKPASCELDWGSGFAILGNGTPTGVCAGDTVLDRSLPRLAYGEASRVGPVACTSRIDGLTCAHDRTGGGFFLSKDSYRLF